MNTMAVLKKVQFKECLLFLGIAALVFILPDLCLAGTAPSGGGSSDSGFGKVAQTLLDGMNQLGKVIFAAAYIAGAGFALGAMMKFKQHKDNPTQVTIGAPLALLFIAVALLFLPSLLKVSAQSLFGTDFEANKPGGFDVQSGS